MQLDAEGIYAALLACLEEIGLPSNQLANIIAGVGADGASVMAGCNAGVISLLHQRVAPTVLPVHCSTHRVSLVCRAACEPPAVKRLESVLRTIYNHFSSSYKHTTELDTLQRELEQQRVYQILKIHDICFISIHNALNRVAVLWEALLQYFAPVAQSMDPNGVWVYDELCDLELMLLVHVLRPLVNELWIASKMTQAQDIFLHDVSSIVHAVMDNVQRMYLSPLTRFQGESWLFWNALVGEDAVDSPLQWNGDGRALCYEVTRTEEVLARHDISYKPTVRSGRAYSQAVKRPHQYTEFVNRVQEAASEVDRIALEDFATRFLSCSVLDALSIVHPRYWESTDASIRFLRDLETLKAKFGTCMRLFDGTFVEPLFDSTLLDIQAASFCSYMVGLVRNTPSNFKRAPSTKRPKKRVARVSRERQGSGSQCSAVDADADAVDADAVDADAVDTVDQGQLTASEVRVHVDSNPLDAERISEFQRVAHYVMAIPIGSVDCKRRFARMRLCKSDMRSSLLVSHLNACVRVASCQSRGMHGVQQFDANRVWHMWRDAKPRRYPTT